MDILDKFFEMKRVSEGTNKMILIFVKPKYLEEMSIRFEMAMVDVSGQPGFIFSGNDVRTLNREYDGDLIDLMFYAPVWKSVSEIKKFLDKDDLEPIHDWNFVLDESKIREGVGDLPAGYTDDDLAEFLDKEQHTKLPEYGPSDDVYDPNDEVIQFIYTKASTDSETQTKIDNQFEGGYLEDSSMATIGEVRKFVTENELDIEDFQVFDIKGEEYFDKLALIYDIQPDLQSGLNESCEEHGPEHHCFDCGVTLEDANFGGVIHGDPFCDDCYGFEMNESTNEKKTNKLTEAAIAGPNGLQFSNDRRTAKHDAADALLRKIGKLPEDKNSIPGKLCEALIIDAYDMHRVESRATQITQMDADKFLSKLMLKENLKESELFEGSINPETEFEKVTTMMTKSCKFVQLTKEKNYQYWRTPDKDPIYGDGIIVTFHYDKRALQYYDCATICCIRSGDFLKEYYAEDDDRAATALAGLLAE